MSGYSKIIKYQHQRLMKESQQIMKRVEASKSLIEDLQRKQREKQDEKELTDHFKQIKEQNFRKFVPGEGTPSHKPKLPVGTVAKSITPSVA